MFRITALALFCFAFSSLALADEGEHEHHGHHLDRYYGPAGAGYYGRAPQYASPPPPRYYSNDQRTHQGLAGGVVGSVLGYELGGGNPIISGLGAAAGSYLGNGMAR